MSIEDARKLFVAGLADSVTEETLRQIFEAVEVRVENVSVPVDRETGLPRGFGFVTLGSAEEAERARQELDRTIQGGKEMSVRMFHAEPPSRREGPRNHERASGQQDSDRTLYVGNLPFDCSQEELREMIGELGTIERISMPVNPNGQPRGFGFVTLQTEEQAHAVLAALAGSSLRGRKLVVNQARARGGQRSERPGRRPERDHGWRPGTERVRDPVEMVPEVTDIPRKTFDGRRRGSGRGSREEREGRERRGRRGKHRERRGGHWRNDYYDDDE